MVEDDTVLDELLNELAAIQVEGFDPEKEIRPEISEEMVEQRREERGEKRWTDLLKQALDLAFSRR